MSKKQHKSVIKFADGSSEAQLISKTAANKQVLALPHNLFSFFFRDDTLFFDIKDELARYLYHADIFERPEATIVPFVDIILSEHSNNSFNWVQNCAGRISIDEYEEEDEDDQLNLLCYICTAFFAAKYSDISSLQDITRPVPIQLFLNILSKNKNVEVMYKDEEDYEYAGKLIRAQINKSYFSTTISISINIISKGKDGYVSNPKHFSLPYITAASKIEDLGLTPVTPEIKERLTERGKQYINYTKVPSYSSFKGFAWRPGSWWGDIRTKIDGRIMVDVNAMRALNSNLDDNWYAGNPFNEDNDVSLPKVAESDLWMCSPVVFGFAFTTKEWIRMGIESVSDIKFSEAAFDELIVPDTYKSIFVSCLTHDMPSLDSIEGKGNGKIFLLYGPPGCGKTMTAESVAEYLKMPIYYVSVGELGVSPETMEKKLTDVMDVAISWNAIVLLDEVDVFAVKRTGSDIQRNAMTAILLRLLERFNGIMFMTTNLIDNLDDAFKSRATACIPYVELNSSDREIIWKGLLRKADGLGIQIDKTVYDEIKTFATHNLNGREIKNHVRLAYSVAMSTPEKKLTVRTLTDILGLRTA